MAAKPRARRRVEIRNMASHLDVDDLPDREPAEQLHQQREAENHPTAFGWSRASGGSTRDRCAYVYIAITTGSSTRIAPVSRPCAVKRLDVAEDPEAVADQLGRVLQDLGQVAARLALEDDGGDEEAQVERVDALVRLTSASRMSSPSACSSTVDRELLPGRARATPPRRSGAPPENEARRAAPHQQVERVRQLFGERVHALRLAPARSTYEERQEAGQQPAETAGHQPRGRPRDEMAAT